MSPHSARHPLMGRTLRSLLAQHALRRAVDGCWPPGFRARQMRVDLTRAASDELAAHMSSSRSTLEMQFAFGAARNGLRKRQRPPEEFPACLALMRAAEDAFGIQRAASSVQVMVRQYQTGDSLALHVDSTALFDEPVLSAVLVSAPASGLLLRRPGPLDPSNTAVVAEQPGLAMCLEGAARYEFGHEVPPVESPRLSLTWRWFKEGALERLLPASRAHASARAVAPLAPQRRGVRLRPAWRGMHSHAARPAAPPSSSISRNGWEWDAALTVDENYMDLAFLIAKSSSASGRVGCVLVRGVAACGTSRSRAQSGEIVVCGVNSGLFVPMQADCHAEANAIAESAAHGWPLRGATAFVSKPPCDRCFALLAVVGVARIVTTPVSATDHQACAKASAQGAVEREVGIARCHVPCTDERRERRERLAAGGRDWERVRWLRRVRSIAAADPAAGRRLNLQGFSEGRLRG